MTVTIYHNPNCSKSRDALRFLTASGIEPEIVLYLKEGWSHDQLIALKTACSMDWTDMLRPDAGALLELMGQDKKVLDGQLRFILTRGIGDSFVTSDVPRTAVLDVLQDALAL